MEENKQIIKHLWDNIKHINIHVMGVLERREREEEAKKEFEEIIAQKLPTFEEKY